MRAASIPDSLRSPSLEPIWSAARARLDRYGLDRRGRIGLDRLAPTAELILTSLLDRPPGKSLDLLELEQSLRRLGIGDNLDGALASLGYPSSSEASRRRDQRQQSERARDAARKAVDEWPEPWATEWFRAELSGGSFAGLNATAAVDLVVRVRQVLDVVAQPGSVDLIVNDHGLASRSDLAARLFGSAHALDSGALLERSASRALQCTFDLEDADDATSAKPSSTWERAGFHLDLVSFPVLTWGLVLKPASPIAELAKTATAAGAPLPVTQMALTDHPVGSGSDAPILVVENPRLVEAAAERQVPFPVITTNGNPRRTPVLLLRQLLSSGATLHYHGDFDSAGLGICRRMTELGCIPTSMTAADYGAACRQAEERGVRLPTDDNTAGLTPWDPGLERAFDARRLVVHEELVVAELLSSFGKE